MSAQVSLELHHRISQFLFHEASLLDDWKLTRKHATAAKASSHRQPGFLMTPKTSWSGESPVWKRAWPGQKSRRHAPVT